MTKSEGRLPLRPCVGIMLLNSDQKIWVGHRPDRRGDAEGGGRWWQMPQGGIDREEDPLAAARRELHEETGVRSVSLLSRAESWLTYDLPPPLVGRAWGGRYRGQRQMWFAFRFEGDESEIDLLPKPGHKQEFDAWRWAEIGELPGIVVPFKRKLYEEVVRTFAPLFRPPSAERRA